MSSQWQVVYSGGGDPIPERLVIVSLEMHL